MARCALRIGFFIIVLGVCIVLSQVATQGPASIMSGSFSTGPNGTSAELFAPLLSGPIEIRIGAARSFEGALYLYNYEGTEKLIEEGLEEPILNESFKGSTLINFNLNRRDACTIVIESHIAEASEGTIGIVQAGGIKADMLQDSSIIIMVGFVIAGLGGAFIVNAKVGRFVANGHARIVGSLARAKRSIDPEQRKIDVLNQALKDAIIKELNQGIPQHV